MPELQSVFALMEIRGDRAGRGPGGQFPNFRQGGQTNVKLTGETATAGYNGGTIAVKSNTHIYVITGQLSYTICAADSLLRVQPQSIRSLVVG